jgi:hypothetical protein
LPRSPIDFSLIVPPFGAPGKRETARPTILSAEIAGERRSEQCSFEVRKMVSPGSTVRGMASLHFARVPFERAPFKLIDLKFKLIDLKEASRLKT